MTTTVIVKPNHGPYLKAEAVVQTYGDAGVTSETIVPCPLGRDTTLHVSDSAQVTVREVAAK